MERCSSGKIDLNKYNEIDSKYETVNGRLTDIESLFEENSPVEIAEGEQSGYYRIYQNAIEHKTNTSFTCSMLDRKSVV